MNLMDPDPGYSTQNRTRLRKDEVGKTPEVWLIAKPIPDLEPKQVSQLPTNGDVFRYFVHLNRGPMQKDRKEDIMLMLLEKTPERGKRWNKPGATHHARWLSTILYSAKVYAFSEQAGYDRSMLGKMEVLFKFNAIFYVEKWLSSSIGADAPCNDLQLWHDLHDYRKFKARVADAARTALERHLRYLTEECAVFSLFSNRVSSTEHQKIARAMHRTPQPEKFDKGLPVLTILNERTKLVNLIGLKSWFLFEAIQSGTIKLEKPVFHLKDDPDYQKAEMFVRHVKVVNDHSERAVKLIGDFASSITNDEEQTSICCR